MIKPNECLGSWRPTLNVTIWALILLQIPVWLGWHPQCPRSERDSLAQSRRLRVHNFRAMQSAHFANDLRFRRVRLSSHATRLGPHAVRRHTRPRTALLASHSIVLYTVHVQSTVQYTYSRENHNLLSKIIKIAWPNYYNNSISFKCKI